MANRIEAGTTLETQEIDGVRRIRIESVGFMDIPASDLARIEDAASFFVKKLSNFSKPGLMRRVFRVNIPPEEKIEEAEEKLEQQISRAAKRYSEEAPLLRRSGFARFIYSEAINEILDRIPLSTYSSGEGSICSVIITTARRLLGQAAEVSNSIDGRDIDPEWLNEVRRKIFGMDFISADDRGGVKELLDRFYSNPPIKLLVE